MFEHVGAGYYNEYFAKLAELLSDDGVAMIHTIGSVGEPAAPHPWIRKYIFPGGYIPSLSEITETLKAWRARFLASREKVIALYDERFCRMWDFYLAACEAAFRYNGLVVFQFQLTKQVTTLPIVRNYIAQDENRLAITADAGCARTSPAAASAAGDRPPRVTRNELTASV